MRNIHGAEPKITFETLANRITNRPLGFRTTKADVDAAFANANEASRVAANMLLDQLHFRFASHSLGVSLNRGALEYAIGHGAKLDEAAFKDVVKKGAELLEVAHRHYGFPVKLEASFTESPATKWSDWRPILNANVKMLPIEENA